MCAESTVPMPETLAPIKKHPTDHLRGVLAIFDFVIPLFIRRRHQQCLTLLLPSHRQSLLSL